MSGTVVVEIPDRVRAELNAFALADGVSEGELVRTAVEEYLIARRLCEIRARVLPQAQAQGFTTDEDVLRAIS